MAVIWPSRQCRIDTLGIAAKVSKHFEQRTVHELIDLHNVVTNLCATEELGLVSLPIHCTWPSSGTRRTAVCWRRGKSTSRQASP